MIPRAWKRREPGPGRCGGEGSRARAGGGRGTESSPPAPPPRFRSGIPESGARPKRRQRAEEQAASRRRVPRPGGGRGLCAPRARRPAAGRLPPAVCRASEPGASRTSSGLARGPEAGGPSRGKRGAPVGRSVRRAWWGARQGSPKHPGLAGQIPEAARPGAHGERVRRLARRRRLGADGAPMDAGWSAARALRRPPPSERILLFDLLLPPRPPLQALPGAERNSGLSRYKAAS